MSSYNNDSWWGYTGLKLRKGLYQRLHAAPVATRTVNFVVGVQRSGTNMLMDIIERCLDTDVFHERDPRAFSQYELRDFDVLEALHHKSRARHVVFKALCELQMLDVILARFPTAKAAWVYRNYKYVAKSMMVSFPSQAAVIQRLARDPDDNGWVGRGMSAETHAILRSFAGPGLTDTDGAALIWFLRNRLYFERGFDALPRVGLVNYESLVSSPGTMSAAVYAFFGMPGDRRQSCSKVREIARPVPNLGLDSAVERLCEELWLRLCACDANLGPRT